MKPLKNEVEVLTPIRRTEVSQSIQSARGAIAELLRQEREAWPKIEQLLNDFHTKVDGLKEEAQAMDLLVIAERLASIADKMSRAKFGAVKAMELLLGIEEKLRGEALTPGEIANASERDLIENLRAFVREERIL